MKGLIIILAFILKGCECSNANFVRKKITNGEVTVKWFYQSYISNTSPDIVIVKKGDEEKEVYRATLGIIDISLHEKTLLLKVVKPSQALVFTREVPHKIFDYDVVLDTAGMPEQAVSVPIGIKEK